MKAYCIEQNQLILTDKPTPKPKQNELLIKVKAIGVNRADLLQLKGKYSLSKEKATPGLEIAGIVKDVGSKDSQFVVNQKVFCLVDGGAYANYCIADSNLCISMPDTWDFAHAAAILENGITVHETLIHHGQLKEKEHILIHAGGSGIGNIAIQMAKHIGAIVYTTVRQEHKISACTKAGADYVFVTSNESFKTALLQITNQLGVQLILDCIGLSYFNDNIESLAIDGCLIQIAYLSGANVSLNLSHLLYKRLKIIGFILRTQSLSYKKNAIKRFKTCWFEKYLSGIITPIIDKVFAFKQASEALQYLEQNKNIGKVIIVV